MIWDVEFHTDFVPEFEGLDESVQDELLAHVALRRRSVLDSGGRVWTRSRVRATHSTQVRE